MPVLTWDGGTAYDLFVSLFVLHRPEMFGVRPSWAAGVRSRLPAVQRDFLEQVETFLPVPLSWLHLLPEEAIQKHPGLLMLKAWVLHFAWRLYLQVQVLQQVEELLDSGEGASLSAEDAQILRGQILTLKSQHAYLNNQTTSAINISRQALALLPASWTFARGGAMFYLGISMQASGLVQAAERLLLDEYESYGDKTGTYALLLLQSLDFIYLNTGQLERTRQIAQVLAQNANRSSLARAKNWGNYFLGMVYYQRNELEAAAQHFTQIVENRFTANLSIYRDAVSGLASIYQIQGSSSDAWQMVESISRADLEETGSEDSRTSSLRARLMLLQGDLESARRWVDTFSDPPPNQPIIWLEEPQMTRARVLIASGTNADLHLALPLLDVLEEIIERTHNARFKIEILALRALTLDDEIDTGGSLVGAVNAVLEQGAKEVYSCCTHPIFSGQATEKIQASPVKEVVITDTVPLAANKKVKKITVLSMAPLLGEAIHRIHTGLSMGAMFE